MTSFRIASTALAATALLALQPGQAAARIVCDGSFQIIKGRHIATPYCEDQNLARVARSYGMRVTDRDIRQNVSTKAGVCRAIGHDNRVRSVCQPYRHEGGGLRFPF